MAVTPVDFILPPTGTGELDPAWWAAGALQADLLPVWIAAGEAAAPDGASTEQADAVTTAYAYGTAYDNKALAMSAAPNSVSVDKGEISAAWTDKQRERVAARAAYWWEKFATALAEATLPPETAYAPPRVSSSVRATVSF